MQAWLHLELQAGVLVDVVEDEADVVLVVVDQLVRVKVVQLEALAGRVASGVHQLQFSSGKLPSCLDKRQGQR